jgi:hypothetical protein
MTCWPSTITSSSTSWRWKTGIPHPHRPMALTLTQGGDGIPGSWVQGYSHPYPKRVRLSLPEAGEQPSIDGESGPPEGGQQPALEMSGFKVGNFFIPCTPPTSDSDVTPPSLHDVTHPPLHWSGSHLWLMKRRLGQQAMQRVYQTLWPGQLYRCAVPRSLLLMLVIQ